MSLPTIGDYIASIKNPQCILAKSLQGGSVRTRGDGSPLFFSGGFAVVFPYTDSGATYAFRCWTKELGDIQRRSQAISQFLARQKLPYFVGFNYIDNAILTPKGPQPIIQMDWVEGKTLKEYIASNLGNSTVLHSLAREFEEMVKVLHQHQIAHGDLQHDNIIVQGDGSLVLVDYDSLFVPSLVGEKDLIKGLPAYQHPSRQHLEIATEALDYFSELVIYLSILTLADYPNFWTERKVGKMDDLFFLPEEIKSKGGAPIFGELASVGNKRIAKLTKTLIKYCQAEQFDFFQPLEQVIQKINRLPWDNKKQVKHLSKAVKPAIEIDKEFLAQKMSQKSNQKRYAIKKEINRDKISTKFKRKPK